MMKIRLFAAAIGLLVLGIAGAQAAPPNNLVTVPSVGAGGQLGITQANLQGGNNTVTVAAGVSGTDGFGHGSLLQATQTVSTGNNLVTIPQSLTLGGQATIAQTVTGAAVGNANTVTFGAPITGAGSVGVVTQTISKVTP